MIISLVATPGRLLTVVVRPDPASVRVGENVSWELSVAPGLDVRAVEWTIYFLGADPFKGGKGARWTQVTKGLGSGAHKGILDAGPAEQPGDYKYGVRTANADTGKELSDDDPYLIVRS